MSAVASTSSLPAGGAGAVHAHSSESPSLHMLEAAEQKRWMVWFGLPALIAALFVGAVFATGQEWYMGFAVAAIVADIAVLIWLTLSTDTNGVLGDPAPAHH